MIRLENQTNYPELEVLEGMTSVSAVINGIRAGHNQRHIHSVLFNKEYVHSKKHELNYLRAMSEQLSFALQTVDAQEINTHTSGNTHGGVVALCESRPLPTLEHALSKDGIWCKPDGFYAMLEGIEDPYNFGYSLRSLYAAGVDGIVLSPRNWMGASGVVARASAGASELLPMVIAEPQAAAQAFKARGVRTVCAGIRDSVSMYEADLSLPLLLVVGGEKRGISRTLLQDCDAVVRIDYGREFRGSLSTASSTAILAFEILHRNAR